MLLFLGLKVLLEHKSKDKDMGKRGKRKNKYNRQEVDDQREAKELIDKPSKVKDEKPKKPFEGLKLLPPRDAQDGTGKF